MENLSRIWENVLDETKQVLMSTNELDEAQFKDYFSVSTLTSLENKEAIVLVPTKFCAMIVSQNKYLVVLQEKLDNITDSKYSIQVVTPEDINKPEKEPVKLEYANNLVADFTFDTFVVGSSNRIAAAAAKAVSVSPGIHGSNPLFIFGNSGIGKTHLVNAIGNKILEYKPDAKIYYTTTNGYMNEYVDSLNTGTINDFNQKYNNLDLLLIDDIQFLEGKDKTAEVFFHLFNTLINSNKQIVITSDRLPQDLTNLHQRLISRFNSGLQVGIDVPEFETSLAILRKKIQLEKIDENLIDEEVLQYMATHYGKDIRELEGKLRRVIFDSVLFKADRIDMNFVLANSFKDDSTKHPTEQLTPNSIIKCVARYYNLSTQQLIGKNRTASVALARSIAMYLVKEDINITFAEIGKLFGGKNHTTVIKACQRVEKNLEDDANYKAAIEEIREKYK